jgi:hypothetical protein
MIYLLRTTITRNGRDTESMLEPSIVEDKEFNTAKDLEIYRHSLCTEYSKKHSTKVSIYFDYVSKRKNKEENMFTSYESKKL